MIFKGSGRRDVAWSTSYSSCYFGYSIISEGLGKVKWLISLSVLLGEFPGNGSLQFSHERIHALPDVQYTYI